MTPKSLAKQLFAPKPKSEGIAALPKLSRHGIEDEWQTILASRCLGASEASFILSRPISF